jgi:hypothetical protein
VGYERHRRTAFALRKSENTKTSSPSNLPNSPAMRVLILWEIVILLLNHFGSIRFSFRLEQCSGQRQMCFFCLPPVLWQHAVGVLFGPSREEAARADRREADAQVHQLHRDRLQWLVWKGALLIDQLQEDVASLERRCDDLEEHCDYLENELYIERAKALKASPHQLPT